LRNINPKAILWVKGGKKMENAKKALITFAIIIGVMAVLLVVGFLITCVAMYVSVALALVMTVAFFAAAIFGLVVAGG
jgi:hypothetical protein